MKALILLVIVQAPIQYCKDWELRYLGAEVICNQCHWAERTSETVVMSHTQRVHSAMHDILWPQGNSAFSSWTGRVYSLELRALVQLHRCWPPHWKSRIIRPSPMLPKPAKLRHLAKSLAMRQRAVPECLETSQMCSCCVQGLRGDFWWVGSAPNASWSPLTVCGVS